MKKISKKVLILSGSPRKGGNSDILCDQFLQGAEDAGHTVEKVFIGDKKINYCIACDVCRRNNGICAYKDDMPELLDKMIQADVIVMASPVYFYTLNAQMKTVIDRTYAKYTKISNKDFYIIMTAATSNKASLESTLACFRGFLSCLSGAKEKGVIYGTGAWNKGDINSGPAFKEAYNLGRTI